MTGVILGLIAAGALALSVPLAVRYVKLLERLPDSNDARRPRIDGFYHLDKIGGPEELENVLRSGTGVRLVDYGPTAGVQYNPVTIAQYVLSLVPFRDDRRILAAMRSNLDFLLEQVDTTPDGNLVFRYEFDWPWREATAPWFSGMAQGQAASALLWGYRTFGDPRYKDAAKKAILAIIEGWPVEFVVPVAGGLWLKEYPTYRYKVINGSLAGVAGVYDLWRSLDESDPDRRVVGELLVRTVAGVKGHFQHFESAMWGHYHSDRGNAGPVGKYAATLAWLDYLAEYDPELVGLRARATARRRARVANVVGVYGWGVRHLTSRALDWVKVRLGRIREPLSREALHSRDAPRARSTSASGGCVPSTAYHRTQRNVD
jgi:hypothetical protein